MKKLSLSIMAALLFATLVILSSTARAQEDPKAEFERIWYAVCYTQKPIDEAKCYQLSKELREKYPNSPYVKNADKIVTTKDLGDVWEKFKAALDAYYAGPDAAKLERLFSTGDDFLAKTTTYRYYVAAQQSIAGSTAVISEIYKDKDKAKGYVEKALKLFDPSAPMPSDEEDKKHVAQFRDDIIASGNQYLGYYTKETKGDPEQAIAYLEKSIAVKSKPNIGWKDPNNYYLRSQIRNDEYVKLSAEYKALPDDQKTGDAGKELLKKINAVVDKLIADHARVIATATAPATKGLQDFARESFNNLWGYRTGAPEKATAYLKNYETDPTIADVAVPAKAETAETVMPGGPPTTGGNVKLSSGSGSAPGSAAANGTKAANSKKPAAKATSKKPTRRKR
jgi:hypothetical protein